MGLKHYDRDGNVIDLWRWAELTEDRDYKRIAETTLDDGTWVSTVWLGIDHNWSLVGPPLFFETMVFPRQGGHVDLGALLAGDPEAKAAAEAWGEQECWRWPTEAAALAGHDQIVAKITQALATLKDACADIAATAPDPDGGTRD